jgi:hypothetical protein
MAVDADPLQSPAEDLFTDRAPRRTAGEQPPGFWHRGRMPATPVGDQLAEVSCQRLGEGDRAVAEPDRDCLGIDRDVVDNQPRNVTDGLREGDDEHARDPIAGDARLMQEPPRRPLKKWGV